jgi:uncharacterized protein YgbK (DUF1537 family)
MRLGCIADDLTGATDLANNLARGGMRVSLRVGVPDGDGHDVDDADAIVISLKSRTSPVGQAVSDSLQAARWLRAHGAAQIYYKICSTFDSTPAGNIGPVAEALADALSARSVAVTPAFPAGGRSVYLGHLFVGTVLLSDSSMRSHPLTPMTDANLVRVLQAQLREARVGLLDHACVAQGGQAVRARLDALASSGFRFAIVDAIDDANLDALARAVVNAPLVVAASGLAVRLPAALGFAPGPGAALPPAHGARAVVSGSCSAATRGQVADFVTRGGASFEINPCADSIEAEAARALAWAARRLGDRPILVYSTAEPDAVAQVQARLGTSEAADRVERILGLVSLGLVNAGVGQILVAGGETSGACIAALGLTALRIGPQIDTGVPWCFADSARIHVCLKSGNFGGADLFSRAFEVLAH